MIIKKTINYNLTNLQIQSVNFMIWEWPVGCHHFKNKYYSSKSFLEFFYPNTHFCPVAFLLF